MTIILVQMIVYWIWKGKFNNIFIHNFFLKQKLFHEKSVNVKFEICTIRVFIMCFKANKQYSKSHWHEKIERVFQKLFL